MADPVTQAPTVLVVRTLVEGSEQAFERWLTRIAAAAEQALGFVLLETPPADPASPRERAVLYRFDTPENLERWLASPARAALLEEVAPLIDAPTREQVLALPQTRPDAATAVLSFEVRAGREQDYREAFSDLLGTIETFDGFLRAELLEPVAGVQEQTVVLFSFATREQLQAWLDSAERARALVDLEPLVAGPRTLNVVGGFAGWFQVGDAPAAVRWKQAVVILIALYPTALALGWLTGLVLPGSTPTPLRVLLNNVLGILVLVWVLVPWLTARLSGWLRR